MRSEVSPIFSIQFTKWYILLFFFSFFLLYLCLFNCLQGGHKSSGDGGPTQRASAMAALSSALNPSSQGKQVLLIISLPNFLSVKHPILWVFSQMRGPQAQVMVGILNVLQQWLPCPLPLMHRQNPAHSHNLIQAKGLKEPLLLQPCPMFWLLRDLTAPATVGHPQQQVRLASLNLICSFTISFVR